MPDLSVFEDIRIRTTAIMEAIEATEERIDFLRDLGHDGEAIMEDEHLMDLFRALGRMVLPEDFFT